MLLSLEPVVGENRLTGDPGRVLLAFNYDWSAKDAGYKTYSYSGQVVLTGHVRGPMTQIYLSYLFKEANNGRGGRMSTRLPRLSRQHWLP